MSEVPLSQWRFPHPDPIQYAKQIEILKSKLKTLPFAVGVALINKNCITTHVWNLPPRPSRLGFDGSDREWCRGPKNNPDIKTLVTKAFVSNTGAVAVVQVRRRPSEDSKFYGLAGIELELDFFINWLKRINTGQTGFISIIDTNQMMLARKPLIPETLGTIVNSQIGKKFIASSKTKASVRSISPVDGVDHFVSYRKVGGLPFIVVVGEGANEALSSWYRQLSMVVIGVVLLWGMAIYSLRSHWQRLRESENFAEAANTDLLTGLLSRRHFIELAEHEINRAHRFNDPVGLMMLDVDHFKAINDTYGHATGDRALVAFAKVCQNILRDVDIVARLGGDEFVVLMPETSGADAKQLAERVCQAVREVHIIDDNDTPISLTTSIGIASAKGQFVPPLEDLINLADTSLYQAKQSGRNAVGKEILPEADPV